MAKRFIDSNIFRKGLVRGLDAPCKLLFLYLICDCDHAGIWDVELDIASLRLDRKYDEAKTLKSLGDVVYPFDDGKKWFLPHFVEFQYGTHLNEANKAHMSVMNLLKKHGLHTHPNIKPLLSGEKAKKKPQPIVYPELFEVFWEAYPNKTGKKAVYEKWKVLKKEKNLPPIDVLTSAIKAQSQSEQWRKDGGKFIPLPTTWLNQHRWNDQGITVPEDPAYKKPTSPQGWRAMRDAYFANPENELLDKIVEKKAKETQNWNEVPKSLQYKILNYGK